MEKLLGKCQDGLNEMEVGSRAAPRRGDPELEKRSRTLYLDFLESAVNESAELNRQLSKYRQKLGDSSDDRGSNWSAMLHRVENDLKAKFEQLKRNIRARPYHMVEEVRKQNGELQKVDQALIHVKDAVRQYTDGVKELEKADDLQHTAEETIRAWERWGASLFEASAGSHKPILQALKPLEKALPMTFRDVHGIELPDHASRHSRK